MVWVGREHEDSFSHELAPLSPDLKFITSLLDVLEETFYIVNTRSYFS